MAETLKVPFDGDPPDRLCDDFQEQLDAIVGEYEHLLERCRELGITAVMIFNSYDQLTGMSFLTTRTTGNAYAQRGMIEAWIDGQR